MPFEMTADEQLCFDAALAQWDMSRKRQDMREIDRVKGALLAYQRQALALQMVRDVTKPV